MKENKNIKACIFDLDGTLLNTLESIKYYLNKTLSLYGFKTVSSEETKEFVGKGARNLITSALLAAGFSFDSEEAKKSFEEIYLHYVRSYDREPFYLTEPYEGIKDIIAFLKDRGIKIAIVSNKPDETVRQLALMNFGDVFDEVRGGRENVPLKPNPTVLYDVCKCMGVLPSQTAYFGDMGIDMQTAKNYGAALAVGVLWGFRGQEELLRSGADLVVRSPFEIEKIFE